MTLEGVCEKLEHVLKVRPVEWWGWIVKDHVRLLVAHGEALIEINQIVHDDLGRLYPHYERFNRLAARAKEIAQ